MRTITVIVKPSSKKGPAIQLGLDGGMLVYVKEPALDGKANRAVIELLAKHFNVPKSKIWILRGLKSNHKTFQIDD